MMSQCDIVCNTIFICFSIRNCTSLDWDKDGDVLAVANDKNGKHWCANGAL